MSKKRILVSDPISEIGVEALTQHPDLQVDVNTGLAPEALLEIIGEYDGLIIRSQTKVTRAVLEAATNLKVIGRAGVGVDNVDREAATDHGVIVMNTPTGNTISTAELAFTLMLSAARNIGPGHAGVLAGDFPAARKAFKGIEIYQKRLAVIGMGRIGTEFVKRAQAFGMTVSAFDPFLTAARAEQLKIELAASPDEALTGADFVTLHVPLTTETKHIINADRLALMNKGAIVVNCARGGLIDEPALRAAIDSGHIAGCGLDVYEDEPPASDHILFDLPRHTAFTPHLGASTNEAQENVGIQVAEQLRDFLTAGEIRNAINMPSLDAAALEDIGEYLGLAKSLGKFIAKLGPISPDSIRVSYHGPIADKDTPLVSRTVLHGFLSSSREDVNIVNCPAIAKELGLELIESTINASTEYAELIVVELKKGGEKFRLAGTIIGKSPRIVEIDKLYVDTNITGNFLIVRNDDRPGIVGLVGTSLAENNLNIANLSLARNKSEGNALSVIELDSPATQEIIDKLSSEAGVLSVKAIEI
ncbi:phosphoglycerate dehydrogenase [Rubritalea tangerina]|uniref:D-3-phosphoglycerate dehydrogenase n=1 Tax=Rubritalea tangerina TaxID=430798 RepID=A0ABW4Z861_9BACT